MIRARSHRTFRDTNPKRPPAPERPSRALEEQFTAAQFQGLLEMNAHKTYNAQVAEVAETHLRASKHFVAPVKLKTYPTGVRVVRNFLTGWVQYNPHRPSRRTHRRLIALAWRLRKTKALKPELRKTGLGAAPTHQERFGGFKKSTCDREHARALRQWRMSDATRAALSTGDAFAGKPDSYLHDPQHPRVAIP